MFSLRRAVPGLLLLSICSVWAGETASSANSDGSQQGGPDRDGVVVNSPKLLDTWPKDGPPLVWKSGFIPSWRDGGCAHPIVADGKVFVYANKLPVSGGDTLKFVTSEILADLGWLPDIPEPLVKKIEEARTSAQRPKARWSSEGGTLDDFLSKNADMDKYTKDFLADLPPDDAKKYGSYIQRRLCTNGFTWDQLVKLSKFKDEGHPNTVEWAKALNGVGGFTIAHHIGINPNLEALWRRAFVWSDTMICLDAATGKELWRKSFPVDKATLKSPPYPGIQWWVFEGLGACATPAVWNGKCYMVGSAGLYCLSTKDGTLVWQHKSGPEHASPLVEDGILYLLGVAYDAETGKVLWKNPEWMLHDGKHSKMEWVARYCGAGLWKSGGKKYILANDGGAEDNWSQVGLELETGKVVWKYKFGGGISGDIMLSGAAPNIPITTAYKVTPTGREELWKGRFQCPGLRYQGMAFGRGLCVNLKNGAVHWKVLENNHTAGVDAQIAADGKIYGHVGAGGYQEPEEFGMFKATPEKYVELGRFSPQACPLSGPTIAGGKLFIRTMDSIACYDLQDHGVYVDGVIAAKDTLTFPFKQTGGGLSGDLTAIRIATADGKDKPAKAQINGENIVVDIKDEAVPFAVSCAAANSIAGKNGKPLPAFGWNEVRVLKYRNAFEDSILLTPSAPLFSPAWAETSTYAVAGAKVTAVEVDAKGRSMRLITDKKWKAGETVKVTYPCFPMAQGEARFESVTATVVEAQRAAAKFVGKDPNTSGDWKGKYGREGAMVAGDKNTSEAPKCALVEFRDCEVHTRWATTEKDTGHPMKSGDTQSRSIQEWHAGDQLFIDLELTDGKEHQVSVYMAPSIRNLTLEVLDADTKAVLDTQSVAGRSPYTYLSWNLKGSVIIHAVNLESPESSGIYVAGVFIDPAGTPAK